LKIQARAFAPGFFVAAEDSQRSGVDVWKDIPLHCNNTQENAAVAQLRITFCEDLAPH
jgi:hypothetical protein